MVPPSSYVVVVPPPSSYSYVVVVVTPPSPSSAEGRRGGGHRRSSVRTAQTDCLSKEKLHAAETIRRSDRTFRFRLAVSPPSSFSEPLLDSLSWPAATSGAQIHDIQAPNDAQHQQEKIVSLARPRVSRKRDTKTCSTRRKKSQSHLLSLAPLLDSLS